MKLLWAKLALVFNIFSLFTAGKHSENNEGKGLLTKYSVSLFSVSVAFVRNTDPLLRTIRATIYKRVL